MGFQDLYTSSYHPQTNGQVERVNKTVVDMLMHYIEDHQDKWDELVSVLVLAYNSRPHRTMGVPPIDLVTSQRLIQIFLERMPDGMTTDPSESVAEAKDAFLEFLMVLPPPVRDSIDKTQARCKRDYEKSVRNSRVRVSRGDWVYLRNHTRKNKLDQKVTGPYEVMGTDGRTYLIDQDGLAYRISGDHVMPAGPEGPANRPKQPKVAVPDVLQPGASEFVFERFVDHTLDEEGVLWLLFRWLGYEAEDNTWQHLGRLQFAAVYRYCRRQRLLPQDPVKGIRVRTPKRRDKTAKRQKTLFRTSNTSHGSSLAQERGATPANAKHTHATYV